jgi:CheY-like chemotaxis protein
MRDILVRLGYEVICQDGTEAVELYRNALDQRGTFDAVIMDLTIAGGMGGKDAVKKLIEIDPNVKAIVSSGYSAEVGHGGILAVRFQRCSQSRSGSRT